MPDVQRVSRSELYAMRAEAVRHLMTCHDVGSNTFLPFGLRYEANVIADSAREALEDIEEALSLIQEE